MTFKLPPYVNVHIASNIRRPRIAAKIYFSSPIRISNAELTYLGEVYVNAGLEVKRLRTEKGGVQTVEIAFLNDNYVYTPTILAEMKNAIRVQMWKFYGDGPFVKGDGIPIFDGELIKPRSLDPIRVVAATKAVAALWTPSITLGPPDVNFLPYPGEVFIWEGERITLQ